jgi:rubrerythrin
MLQPVLVKRALRRALLLSLSLPPCAAQVACGGNVVVDQGSGGSTGTGGAGIGGAGGAITFTTTTVTFTTTTQTGTVGSCQLLSTTPLMGEVGGCAEELFSISPCDSVPLSQCASLCPLSQMGALPAINCGVSTSATGSTLACQYTQCLGRRPPGLVAAREEGSGAIARYLGHAAHLEAASVVAFERLAAELRAHRAPETLVRAARRSARDEVRHARVTGRFAEKAGVHPQSVAVEEAPALRSLEALAVDNAVEGCVRETFGALVAMHQVARAADPDLQRAMETIARDETRHAELAWALARWLDEKLDVAARERVRRERDAAVEALLGELAAEPDPALVRELGMPTGAEARAAVEDLRASLWS